MLVPAAILVMVLLGAIAVDSAVLHMSHLDATSAAESAANDAVTAGLDVETFRTSGEYRLDPERAQRIAGESIQASGLADRIVEGPTVTISTNGTTPVITVALVIRADYIFAQALPGSSESKQLAVSATAEARTP